MNDLHPIDVLLLPAGQRRRVHPGARSDTVADLAAALGSRLAGGALVVDGIVVPGRTPLALSGISHASWVAVPGTVPGRAVPTAPALVAVTVEAGPAAGARYLLSAGRHVVGRSRAAAVRIDDATLEPHQLLVDVDDGGEVALTQIAGRLSVRDERGRGGPRTVVVGASRLRIERLGGPVAPMHPPSGGAQVWHRPVRVIEPAPEPVGVLATELPASRPSRPAGSAGAVVGLAGSAVVATITGQVLFLVMGAVGAAGALAAGWWPWIRWVAGTRRRRRLAASALAARAEIREVGLARLAEHARRRIPDLAETLARVESGDARLWERRPHHVDAAEVVLGPGQVRHEMGILDDVPVTVDVGPGGVVGLAGPCDAVSALARSLVVQRAAASGPADWRLVVVTTDRDAWSWVEWLPHAVVTGAEGLAVEGIAESGDPRALLLVVTDPAVLAARTGAVRRLADEPWVGTVVLAADRRLVPAWCTTVVELRADATGRVVRDPGDPLAEPTTFHPAGLDVASAASSVAHLCRMVDPECAPGTALRVADVSLLDLLGERAGSAEALAATWASARTVALPAVPLGVAAQGPVEVDLVRDGPHALVAGTTGAGKSELLRTLVLGLAAVASPDDVVLVLVDYKGGATFDPLARLPHTVDLVTDLDGGLADRLLRSLEAELRRREAILRAAGAADLEAHRRGGSGTALARLVVVVDELAALTGELPEFVTTLIDIARRGRSLGVHLVLATQRPAGVVDDHVRANTQLRIALRLHDRGDAIDVVGDAAAAGIPRHRPGRALVRRGPDELVEVQVASSAGAAAGPVPGRLVVDDATAASPHCSAPVGAPSELDVLVERITRAAELAGIAPPAPPWLAPLPDTVDVGADPSVVGVADDPDGQRRLDVRWSPESGHSVVAGGIGAGVTSTLLSLARAATSSRGPDDLHLYVLDGRGDHRWSWVESLPHVGGVVPVGDPERRRRLLARIGAVVSERATTNAARTPVIVVIIDGIGTLRGELDDPARLDEAVLFERIMVDGPAVGVVLAIGTDRPADVPSAVTARAPTRWVLRLADPTEAVAVGVRAADVPRHGPGRMLDVGSGLEAQLVVPPGGPWPVAGPRSASGGVGPAPLGVLVPDVAAHSLPPPSASIDGCVAVPVGLADLDLAPVTLEVPDGEPVLVIGPARSGRSTALARLALAWSQARPGAQVAVVTPRRSPLAEVARDRGWSRAERPAGTADLWVVDDAELVADLVRSPGVVVMAATRGDALRGAFGHWTASLRQGRRGLLLGSTPELDADLLGVQLRRGRGPVPVPPGRGWLVADGLATLVQVARDP